MIPAKGQLVSVLVGCTALLLCAAVGVAQDEPVVIGQRPRTDAVHIDRPNLALEFESIYNQNTIKTAEGTVKSQELVFTEKLIAETEGYILNPSFIDLSLKGEFGLSQSSSELNGISGSENGTVYTWDLQSTYRRASDTPFSIFSQREQSFLSRDFGPTLENTSTTTGAALEIRTGWLPSRFQVSRLETVQTAAVTGELDFSLTRDNFNWQARATPGMNQTLTWFYDYSHIQQNGQTSSEFDTHDATLVHEYLFGLDTQSSLTSTLDYNMQSAEPSLQRFRWDERLFLKHSDTLETRYRYTFDQYEFPSGDRMRNHGSAQFTHRLYKSLITRGTATITRVEESQGFTSMQYDLDLRFDYTKIVPYGKLTANLNLFYSNQDNTARTVESSVFDLPVTFNDPAPIVLTGTNVQPDSLVLTDPSGLFIFTPGIDYTVTAFPDRVEIGRIVGGSIPANSTVLVDYTQGTAPGNVTTTTNISVGGRYDIEEGLLRGLSLYGQFTVQDQTVDPANPTVFISNAYTDLLAGVQYRRGPWLATAEHQIHDSDVVPYDASRLTLQYSQRRGNWSTTGNAAYTLLNYVDEDNRIELLTLSAQTRYQFSRHWEGIATVLWRDQQADVGGSTRGFEQQLEIRWWYRQTRIYARLRNSMLETDTQDNDFQFFQMGIRREF